MNVLSENATVTINGVWFDKNTSYGILSQGGETHILNTLISSTLEGDGPSNAGLGIYNGGNVYVESSLIENNSTNGIEAGNSLLNENSEKINILNLKNSIIKNTQSLAETETLGIGVNLNKNSNTNIEKALIKNNRTVGLSVNGTNANAELINTLITNTKHQENNGKKGNGLQIINGAFLSSNQLYLKRNRSIGVMLEHNGSFGLFNDIVVKNTLSRFSDLRLGQGIFITNGAEINLKRGLFDKNKDVSVFLKYNGVNTNFSDLIIINTLSDSADLTYGQGIHVSYEGYLNIKRGLVNNCKTNGIYLDGSGIIAILEDIVIKNTKYAENNLIKGIGIQINDGAKVTINRAHFENNHTASIYISDENTTADLSNIKVLKTLSQRFNLKKGRGIFIRNKAKTTLRKSYFDNNRDVAIFVHGINTKLDAEDITVTNMLSEESTKRFGRGLSIIRGAEVSVQRGYFNNCIGESIFISNEGTKFNLSNLKVENTKPDETTLLSGQGLRIQDGVEGLLKNTIFLNNSEVTISVYENSILNIEQVLISGTLKRACAELINNETMSCLTQECGSGLVLFLNSKVKAKNLRIEKSNSVGLQIARFSTFIADKVEIVNNPIAINIQEIPSNYIFNNSVLNLVLSNNVINYDSTILDIPNIKY